jgi:uncharacterized protein YndB with AHSA1/START domain
MAAGEPSVKHDTLVLERHYDVPPARVFAAWADPAARALWDVPDESWELTAFGSDFRVGGREFSRFGPNGDPRYWSEGLYLDIVPDRRIVSAGTMHDGDVRTSVTLATVELRPEGEGTRLVLTDQSAFLDGYEDPAARRVGYRAVLDKLTAFLKLEST